MITTLENVKRLIAEEKKLVIAADEKMLRLLPRGDWIGGTIPYFMTEEGGRITRDELFVNEMPSFLSSVHIALYNESELQNIVAESPANGFSVVILPAFSRVHQEYAMNAATYEGIFFKSITGWISGIHLDDFGSVSPKVISGKSGEFSDDKGVVMHIELPASYQSQISVVNIFEMGDGDVISFPEGGFQCSDCYINGEKRNFHDYVLEKKIDTRLPLVSNFCGTMVNVSIQGLNEKEKSVQFYAPIFEGVEYKFAKPVDDYAAKFQSEIPGDAVSPAFACNCILNFLYGSLEGKTTGTITGPMTFGEIAYQLLNQTMVFLEINRID